LRQRPARRRDGNYSLIVAGMPGVSNPRKLPLLLRKLPFSQG